MIYIRLYIKEKFIIFGLFTHSYMYENLRVSFKVLYKV